MSFSWKSLQNGSDIRGVALPGIPGEEVNLTNDVAERLGRAFYNWLIKSGNVISKNLTIGIGTDSRISGPKLKAAFSEGLIKQGARVLDFGIATTPAMFMSTQFSETKCDGAVMITASHLPPNRNGFKFFNNNAGLEKNDITDILNFAEKGEFKTKSKGVKEQYDIITPYSQFIIDYIRRNTSNDIPLSGLKIIVDAGNGAGGFFANKILTPLGADTTGSIFLDPDGNFPNHIPNPEDKKAINAITQAVIKNKADLGIIFDTDVDRAAVIDSRGKPINRNALIALLSAIVLKEHPASCIVTDSVTSDGLSEFISKLGGKHHRFKRGYKNVINESIRLNNENMESWLGIETSGHAAFKENYFLDDGAFLIAKILVETAKLSKKGTSITNLIKDLKEPKEAVEYRIRIDAKNFRTYGNSVIEELKNYVKTQNGWIAEKINYEGYRVKCAPGYGDGWFLLRLSLHDPILPLNIESNENGGVEHISSKMKTFLSKFNALKNIYFC